MGVRCPKDPSDPVEPIEFDKLRLNPPFCTHILQKNLLLILILGLRPHFANLTGSMEPIKTVVTLQTELLRIPLVLNPRKLKLQEEGIP